MKEQNQQHPPLPKRKRVDAKGNDKRRIFVTSGNASIMFARGLNKNACDILEQRILNEIKNLGGECTCGFRKWK